MGIVRTGRSLLTSQMVRVDRRRRESDFMGGASEHYDTIVPRYWVRLWPDQHEARERVEPGEQAENTTHTAVGSRTLNGMSVMIGDRFIDEGNNEVFDVVGVRRPAAFSSYNIGLVRYTLRIVKDLPCPGVS